MNSVKLFTYFGFFALAGIFYAFISWKSFTAGVLAIGIIVTGMSLFYILTETRKKINTLQKNFEIEEVKDEIARIKELSQEYEVIVSMIKETFSAIKEMAQELKPNFFAIPIISSEAQNVEDLTTFIKENVEKIYSKMKSLSQNLEGIRHLSEEVTETARSIDAMASRLNFLGVNAAIEAALTGEEDISTIAERIKEIPKEFEELAQSLTKLNARLVEASDSLGVALKKLSKLYNTIKSGCPELSRELKSEIKKLEEVNQKTSEAQKFLEEVSQKVSQIDKISPGTFPAIEVFAPGPAIFESKQPTLPKDLLIGLSGSNGIINCIVCLSLHAFKIDWLAIVFVPVVSTAFLLALTDVLSKFISKKLRSSRTRLSFINPSEITKIAEEIAGIAKSEEENLKNFKNSLETYKTQLNPIPIPASKKPVFVKNFVDLSRTLLNQLTPTQEILKNKFIEIQTMLENCLEKMPRLKDLIEEIIILSINMSVKVTHSTGRKRGFQLLSSAVKNVANNLKGLIDRSEAMLNSLKFSLEVFPPLLQDIEAFPETFNKNLEALEHSAREIITTLLGCVQTIEQNNSHIEQCKENIEKLFSAIGEIENLIDKLINITEELKRTCLHNAEKGLTLVT